MSKIVVTKSLHSKIIVHLCVTPESELPYSRKFGGLPPKRVVGGFVTLYGGVALGRARKINNSAPCYCIEELVDPKDK